MSLSPGARLGAYEVLSALGAGGMGEVYRAKDTNLNRDVALKILPAAVAADVDRVARFKREAQVLALLNHPHIAAIYGVEQNALVMELVEGEDLAQRLARGALGLDEALPIARQIAVALEAAHEQGIVHRDLKPANIKLRDDGTVKVLDFGLAKAFDQGSGGGDPASPQLAHSPTITSPGLTQAGIVLGTAAYMSPEQARGRAVDKRTDVWAFGCVIYQMLTGRPAFDGEDAADVISAVLKSEPDWAPLPASVPPHVRAILTRCLAKDRKERIPDMSVVRFALDGSLAAPAPAAAVTASAVPWWRGAWPYAAAVAAGAAAVLMANPLRWARQPDPAVTRLSIDGTGDVAELAISPDGSRVVMTRSDGLALRSMSSFEVVPLTIKASRVRNAVFSPDGQSVSFTAGPILARTTTAGGSTVDLATLPGDATGCQWTGDDIYCAVGSKGVVRVPAAGGAVEPVITLPPGEAAATPVLVPGGATLLFTLAPGTERADWTRSSVVAQSLPSGSRTVIATAGSDPHYLPGNQIGYVHEGVLFTVGFDPATARAVGAPVAVLEGVARRNDAGLLQPRALLDISPTGTLVYARGPLTLSGPGRQVVLADRAGSEHVLPIEPRDFESPRISPDGKHLALSTDADGDAAVWLYDLSGTSALRRLTFAGRNRLPVWSPDGRRIAFQSDRGGDTAIFVQAADGSSDAERWTTAPPGTVHTPEAWSRNGRYLAYSSVTQSGADLMLRSLPDGEVARFGDAHSTAPLNAVFSPDGRWIAYTVRTRAPGSAASTAAVFMQPVPPTGAKYQISSDSSTGHHPFWSPDGTEFFYWGRGGGTMLSTAMPARGPVSLAPAVPVPGDHASNMTALSPRNYDITPDGRQFVLTRRAGMDAAVSTGSIHVVLNWLRELKPATTR